MIEAAGLANVCKSTDAFKGTNASKSTNASQGVNALENIHAVDNDTGDEDDDDSEWSTLPPVYAAEKFAHDFGKLVVINDD